MKKIPTIMEDINKECAELFEANKRLHEELAVKNRQYEVLEKEMHQFLAENTKVKRQNYALKATILKMAIIIKGDD